MCGSGTLPIEAALIAADRAPGLHRTYFGFLGWAGHDAAAWEALKAEAHERAQASSYPAGLILGSDHDPRAVEIARSSVVLAGVDDLVRIDLKPLVQARPPGQRATGLVLVNPPYGERLGEYDGLRGLYAELGLVLKERFVGWHAGVLTGNPALCRELKIEARRTHKLFNGPIEVQLLRFLVTAEHFSREHRPGHLPAFLRGRRHGNHDRA